MSVMQLIVIFDGGFKKKKVLIWSMTTRNYEMTTEDLTGVNTSGNFKS